MNKHQFKIIDGKVFETFVPVGASPFSCEGSVRFFVLWAPADAEENANFPISSSEGFDEE